MKHKPNVVLVFADQWRAQATGYTGDVNVKTPRLDALSTESLNFTHAVSNCPVCSPFRGSLMTGQYPLTHGVFGIVGHVEGGSEARAQRLHAAPAARFEGRQWPPAGQREQLSAQDRHRADAAAGQDDPGRTTAGFSGFSARYALLMKDCFPWLKKRCLNWRAKRSCS